LVQVKQADDFFSKIFISFLTGFYVTDILLEDYYLDFNKD
jgi:hypothetical protein